MEGDLYTSYEGRVGIFQGKHIFKAQCGFVCDTPVVSHKNSGYKVGEKLHAQERDSSLHAIETMWIIFLLQ